MNKGARDAALWAVLRQLRIGPPLARHVAAASVLLLRGPLREIDDRLCRMDLLTLERLPAAEAGLASIN